MAGRRTRRLRRTGIVGLALAVTSTMLPLMPAHAEDPDPLVQHMAQGLAAFADSTVDMGQLPPLSQPLPGSATSAAQLVGLDAGFVAAALAPELDAVEQLADLEDRDSSDPLGSLDIGTEYDATITSTAVETPAATGAPRQLDVTLGISATRTADLPLGYVDPVERDPDDPDDQGEPLDLTGGTVSVQATATGTFEFTATETVVETEGVEEISYDFWLNGTPLFTVVVDGTDDALDFDGRYGFTDISVGGAVTYDAVEIEAAFVDPNADGAVKADEFQSTIAADLFDVAFTDGAVDVALDIDSDLVDGTSDGTLTASEDDLAAAAAYPAVVFAPGDDLAEFATISADDGLLGVGQTGVALRSMLGTANARLPFLDGFVGDLYDPGAALFEFAEARANAVIVCGSADTLPPTGRLTAGDVAYCQATTGTEATDVTWGKGTSTSVSGSSDGTVGLSPTANVTVTEVALPLDISVTFTEEAQETGDDAATPPTHTVVPRFATAQELQAQLDAEGFNVAVDYDSAANSLRYDVQHATGSKTVEVPFDVGDTLRPGANLTKVEATAGDPVSVTMTDGELDATFGIQLGELDDIRFIEDETGGEVEYVAVKASALAAFDDGATVTLDQIDAADIVQDPFILEDRFTIDRGEDSMISIGGISVADHDADFTARIGMLPVDLSTTDFTIAGGGDPTLTVGVPGTDPVQINEFVTDQLETVDSELDLGATMTLQATGGSVSDDCCDDLSGALDIDWADVGEEPLPAVVPDADYATDLAPFDIRATVEGFVGDAAAPSTTTLIDPNADFLTAFGLTAADLTSDPEAGGFEVGAPLLNTTDGTMCGAFTVIAVDELQCDEPLAGGADVAETIVQRYEDDPASLQTVGTGTHEGTTGEVLHTTADVGTPVPGDLLVHDGSGDTCLIGDVQTEELDVQDPSTEEEQPPAPRDITCAADGAQLQWDDGDTFTIFTIEWQFNPGDTYQIPGDPEALRKVILESLVQVSTSLQNHDNPAFNDVLPLVELRPQDAVVQFDQLREVLAALMADIEAHAEERTPEEAVDGDGNVEPATEPAWATLGGLLDELATRINAHWCDTVVDGCTDPDSLGITVDLDHNRVGGTGYLQLRIAGLPNAGTIEVPLRVDLGEGMTLTQPDAIEGEDAPAQEPFSFDAVHDSTAALGIGIPLAKGVPATSILVLPGSGVSDLNIALGDDHVALDGAIGAVGLNVGEAASLNGTHHAPESADVLAVDGTGVEPDDILRNLTTPATCVVASADADGIVCTDPMSDGENEVPWAAGHEYVVSRPPATATGTNTPPEPGENETTDTTKLYTTDDLTNVDPDDLLSKDGSDELCLIGTITPGTDPEPSVVECVSGDLSITWADGDAFTVLDTVISGTYDPAPNTTVLHDPTADFEAFGVTPGVTLEHVVNDTTDATCVVDTVSTDELVCAASLTNDQEWAHGDGYRIAGVGILHLALDASLLVDTDAVAVEDLYANLVGTLANADHSDCDGDETTTDTVQEACARLSLELQDVPEPENEEDPPAHSYLGIIDLSVDLARTETGGEGDVEVMSFSTTSSTAVLTEPQKDALGVSPLDWSLLPATTPYLAFLMGDALDGSSSGARLPLIGDQLDAGADIEQKLLALSSDLAEIGYDLDDAIEAYDPDPSTGDGPRRQFIRQTVVDAITAAGGDLLDGVTPTVTVVCDGAETGPCDSFDQVSDVRVAFTVGETGGTGTTGFESGLPGLQLYADEDSEGAPSGNIETEFDWSLDVAFGIDKLFGPYIAGRSDGTGEEFELTGGATIGEQSGCETTDPPNPSTLEDYADGFSGGRCIQGRFGLLKGTMFDAAGEDTASDLEIRSTKVSLPRVDPSDEKLTFADLIDGVETTPEVDARGTINLLLQSAPPDDPNFPLALPRLLSVFTIDYDSQIADTMGEADWWHPDYEPRRTNGWTSPGWYDAVMDLGPFVTSILGPVLADVTSIAKPLKPVIDIVSAPIPVITDLHQAVGRGPLTMLDVLEQVSGNDLTLLRRILATIQLAGSLPAGNNQTLYIRLDSATDWSGGHVTQPNIAWKPNFVMDVEDVEEEPCEIPKDGKSCKKTEHDWKNGQGKSTYDSIKKSDNGKMTRHASGAVSASGAGITFPFLDDVRQVYGLFVGVDATLVRIDAGTLSATAGMSFSFGPFMAGPVPVEVQLGGSITLNGRFAMGYDTRGLRRMVAGEDPSTDSYLLDGMFIDDFDTDGKDVHEIELIVSVSAGASASLKIVKVGLEAVVTVTIGLNFNDPDKSGKLYLEEVMMWMENPVCLFDVKGTLDFVLQLFFEINLFVKKIKFTQVLYKLKPPLVLFEHSCSPPPPVWADDSGANLLLNLGDRASYRGQFTSVTNEKFTVRQMGAVNSGADGGTPVEVTAFGIPLPYEIPAGGKVIANTGGGNDTVRLLPGEDENGDAFPFDRPSTMTATAGANRFEGGDAADELTGGSGKDVLRGGAANDTLKAGGGDDALDGGTGNDLLYGEGNDDRLLGGPGRDLLHGGDDNDNLDGGPGLRAPAPRDRAGNLRDDLLDPGNVLIGGAGDDTINGGPVTDYLFGDDVPDGAGWRTFPASGDRTFLNGFFGGSPPSMPTYCAGTGTAGTTGGVNTLAGHDGDDYLFGGKAADTADGGRGDDLLCTGAGDDVAHGGKGSDELWGGADQDRLEGGVGDDDIHGGSGDDLLVDGDGANVLVGGEGADQLAGADTGGLYVGDDLGIRTGGNVARFATTDTWPAPGADLTGTATSTPTIFEASTAVSGGVTVCASGVVVIEGKLDLNADREVGAADDGWFDGYPVINGLLDIDGSTVVDGDDNGIVAGYAVQSGLVDLLGTGTPVIDDPLGTRIEGPAFAGTGNGDCILAGTGNDRLYGVDGGDHLDAGDGDDYLEGNRGGDFVRGAQGVDTAFGGDGQDEMYGDSGRDALYGGAGDDDIFGGPDHDYAEGNQGDDTLAGGSEDDVLLGGSSSRTHPSTMSATGDLTRAAGDDTINGDDGQDLAFGDNANIPSGGSWTFGSATAHGDDDIFGGPGHDLLLGQLGSDSPADQDLIEGGDGHDYAFGDLATVALPDGGWATPPDWHSMVFPSATADGGATHWPGGAPNYTVSLVSADDGGDDAVLGQGDDDHLFGGAAADVIEGGFGDDYIEGNGGGDTIHGLAAEDPAAADALAAILSTSSDQDVILGGSSAAHAQMTMAANGAADTGDVIRGNDAQDVILGDNGTVIRGVDGAQWASDTITGGHARTVTLNDRTRPLTTAGGTAGQEVVSGDDIILGDDGNDRIFGSGGNDHLRGNDGQDSIEGNQASDWIEGNDGADDLIGGSSCAAGAFTCTGDPDTNDLLFGGAGQDVAAGDNAVIERTDTADDYLTTDGRLLGFAPHRWISLLDLATSDTATFGDDRISGGSDDDVLLAQSGDDWTSGGPGADYAEGNTGADGIFGDRLLSEIGHVAKVRAALDAGEDAADVLAVPAALRAADTKAGTLDLTKRLDADFAIDSGVLADLEGLVNASNDEGQLDGQDDLVGGSRSAGTADFDDLIWGDGEADAMAGDNADAKKQIVADEYVLRKDWYAADTTTLPSDYGQRNLAIERLVEVQDDGASGANLVDSSTSNVWGDDFMDGGDGEDFMQGQDGHDEMWGSDGNDVMAGRVGNDEMYGGDGDDAMLGARGAITRTYINNADTADFPQTVLTYNQPPFLNYQMFVADRLYHRITVPTSDTGKNLIQDFDGDDLMRGGKGRDDLHGGGGDDRINGDSGGDSIFAGDGNDAAWGGRGDDAGTPDRGTADEFVDYLFGGHGGDKLDYQPQTAWDGSGDAALQKLFDDWTEATEPYWHPDADVTESDDADEQHPQHHRGIDWIYGGWDADVLQADVSQTGPNDGDRLIDWTGAYNLYTACPSDYGGHNHIRAMSPQMIDFLEQLAYTKGAGTIDEVKAAGNPAFRNVGLVYTKDGKANSGKAYADEFGKTPGHLFEAITCS